MLTCTGVLGQTAGDSALETKVRTLIEASPLGRRAFWGIHAVDLATGRTIYEFNADKLFAPASNTKLFSTAIALARLGPDFRFETRVMADAPPDAAGCIHGNLTLVGGGDPTLSGRQYPYQKQSQQLYQLQAIETFADQIILKGVRRIEGSIVGDDTAYVWAPYPDGWTQDDELWDYGAPVSALSINDNTFQLTVRPGEDLGRAARISLSPALEYFQIQNRVETVAKAEHKLQIDRAAGSRELLVWGSIARRNPGIGNLLAIDEPALYAAYALHDSLTRRGVAISGPPLARHLYPAAAGDLLNGSLQNLNGGVELARRTSTSLLEIARVVNKVSQNLHAEILLREVARRRRGIGSREAGLAELTVFLAEAGITPQEYHFEDGSGLSRITLVTPRAISRLLAFMDRSRNRDSWFDLMPVGGEDGTLATRFEGAPDAQRIHAKTGSLSHVAALSGYADRPPGGRVAFSIVVNNFNGPAAEVRKTIDQVAMLLTQ